MNILEVRNLSVRFGTKYGVVKAVDDVNISVAPGRTVSIVGESGSGKTVTALSVMGLVTPPGKIHRGAVWFNGEEISQKSREQIRLIRGKDIAMVFQDSLNSLNPTMTIGEQIGRVMASHQTLSRTESRDRAIKLLNDVGIPEPTRRVNNYPHEFSGGMRQRALIAMAISCRPKLLILDEPTTALDVTVEAQIFDLVSRLKAQYGLSVVLITHDLSVVASVTDTVYIMYAGRVVETGSVHGIFKHPLHPYTKGLFASMPARKSNKNLELTPIPGEVPDLIDMPTGCNFQPRCQFSAEECRVTDPALEELRPDHFAACIRTSEIQNQEVHR